MSNTQALLRREAAAIYVREKFGIPCARSWLAKLACVGGGPSYRLAGRIPLYAKTDLDNWATSRLSRGEEYGGVRKLPGKAAAGKV